MLNNRSIWLILLGTVLFFGAALFTLRAAEQAVQPSAHGGAVAPARADARPSAAVPPQSHPAPSAPEESASISDDPTTAPDPAQSADNNVSFPNDI